MGKASVAKGRSSEKARRNLIDRSKNDPSFVGWALRQHAVASRLSDQQVLSWLECSPTNGYRLALCLMPDPSENTFSNSVRKIARFVGCNADRLVQLLREVSAFAALRSGHELAAAGEGLLMAARDRKDDKDTRKE